jgi:hypothetical protein
MADDKEQIGFDRGVNYEQMKDKLINDFKKTLDAVNNLDQEKKSYEHKKNNLIRRVLYIMIACIQLRNGSRISEAVSGFKLFLKEGQDLNEKISVKIAKSKTLKVKRETKEVFSTKTRYRKIIWPVSWIGDNIPFAKEIREFLSEYEGCLEKRVLDFLLNNYQCNSHSLRYACINHLLYHEKKEMPAVAKFVGHSNINQLVRYTQVVESDKLFELDI